MLRSIPEEVARDIRTTHEGLSTFLKEQGGEEMNEVMWSLALERLVVNGHLPLPCTLTEANAFLGTYDTSSLPQKGADDR